VVTLSVMFVMVCVALDYYAGNPETHQAVMSSRPLGADEDRATDGSTCEVPANRTMWTESVGLSRSARCDILDAQ